MALDFKVFSPGQAFFFDKIPIEFPFLEQTAFYERSDIINILRPLSYPLE